MIPNSLKFQVHGKDANANGYDSDDSDETNSTTTPSLVSPASSGATPGPQQQQQPQQITNTSNPQTIVSHSDWYSNLSSSSVHSAQTSLPTPPSNEHSPVQQHPQQQQATHLVPTPVHHHLHHHSIGGLISAVQSSY